MAYATWKGHQKRKNLMREAELNNRSGELATNTHKVCHGINHLNNCHYTQPVKCQYQ